MTVTMTTDSAKVEELFDAARRRPADERPRFLDEACKGDVELRNAVDSLLRAHDQAERFLETQPQRRLEAPGSVIGRYKLLELVGEGGYGTVFMAEQTSPVQRKVALKIIKA